MNWFQRLFTESIPTCPGCGREFIEWLDSRIKDGYNEEMRWKGCPEYKRLSEETGWTKFQEQDKHYARWWPGKKTPLTEL